MSLKKELLKSGDYYEKENGKLVNIRFDGKDHLEAQKRFRASVTQDKKKKANKNACRKKTSINGDW